MIYAVRLRIMKHRFKVRASGKNRDCPHSVRITGLFSTGKCGEDGGCGADPSAHLSQVSNRFINSA